MPQKPYLGEILLRRNLLTASQLESALSRQKATGEFLGAIILKQGLVTERNLLEALSEQFEIPFISVEDKKVDWQLVEKFSASLIVDHCCFPIESDQDYITFAIINPLDAWLLNEAERQSGDRRVKLVLVTQSDMNYFLKLYRQYAQSKLI